MPYESEDWTLASKTTTPSDSSDPSSETGNGFPGIGFGTSLRVSGDKIVHDGGIECPCELVAVRGSELVWRQRWTEACRVFGCCGDTGETEPCDTKRMNFDRELGGDNGIGSRYVCDPIGFFSTKCVSAGSTSYVADSNKVRSFGAAGAT